MFSYLNKNNILGLFFAVAILAGGVLHPLFHSCVDIVWGQSSIASAEVVIDSSAGGGSGELSSLEVACPVCSHNLQLIDQAPGLEIILSSSPEYDLVYSSRTVPYRYWHSGGTRAPPVLS